jgi:hypothetical protein
VRAIAFAILFVGLEIDLLEATSRTSSTGYRTCISVLALGCLIGAVVCIVGGW